jgi:hypothetical protein
MSTPAPALEVGAGGKFTRKLGTRVQLHKNLEQNSQGATVDPLDDIRKVVAEGFRAIRERVAVGGRRRRGGCDE